MPHLWAEVRAPGTGCPHPAPRTEHGPGWPRCPAESQGQRLLGFGHKALQCLRLVVFRDHAIALGQARNQIAGLVLDGEKHVHQVNIQLEGRHRRFLGRRSRRVLTGGASGEGASWATAGTSAGRPSSNAATPHRGLIPALLDEIPSLRRAYLNGFPRG